MVVGRSRQIDGRKEGGTGGVDVRVPARETGFGLGNVQRRQQQLRGQTGRNQWQRDALEFLRLYIETFRRSPQQNGKREQSFVLLLLKHGNVCFLLRDERLFLREVQLRRHTVRQLRLRDHQNALGVLDILLRKFHAPAQCQDVEIGRADIRNGRQRDAFLCIARRSERLFRGAQIVLCKAPEIDVVARVRRDAEIVEGASRPLDRRTARRDLIARRLLSAGGGIERDVGKQRRAVDVGRRGGLQHVRESDGDIEVVGLGLCDKPVELRALEAVPPLLVRPHADGRRNWARELYGDVGWLQGQGCVGRAAGCCKAEHQHGRPRHQFRHGTHSFAGAPQG